MRFRLVVVLLNGAAVGAAAARSGIPERLIDRRAARAAQQGQRAPPVRRVGQVARLGEEKTPDDVCSGHCTHDEDCSSGCYCRVWPISGNGVCYTNPMFLEEHEWEHVQEGSESDAFIQMSDHINMLDRTLKRLRDQLRQAGVELEAAEPTAGPTLCACADFCSGRCFAAGCSVCPASTWDDDEASCLSSGPLGHGLLCSPEDEQAPCCSPNGTACQLVGRQWCDCSKYPPQPPLFPPLHNRLWAIAQGCKSVGVGSGLIPVKQIGEPAKDPERYPIDSPACTTARANGYTADCW